MPMQLDASGGMPLCEKSKDSIGGEFCGADGDGVFSPLESSYDVGDTPPVDRQRLKREVLRLCQGLGMPKEGLMYVEQAFARPQRLVKPGQRRVVERFASRKMGVVIQAESVTCELPFVHRMELDHKVIAYLDQPPKLHYQTFDRRGRRHPEAHTPDFLVIRNGRATLVECKPGEALRELCLKFPDKFVEEAGRFHSPPRTEAAAKLGLIYEVHDSDTIGQIEQANLWSSVVLRRQETPSLDQSALAKARRYLSRTSLTIAELAERLKIVDLAKIMASVVDGHLFIPFRTHLLSSTDTTPVFAEEGLSRMADEIIEHDETARIRLLATPLLSGMTEKAVRKAHERITRLGEIDRNERVPDRSDYRVMALRRNAIADGSLVFLGLVPRYTDRGRHGTRLPPQVIRAMSDAIKNRYHTKERPNLKHVYFEMLHHLAAIGLHVSYESFRRFARRTPARHEAGERIGRRAANAASSPTPPNMRVIRRVPCWQYAYVDSTSVDEKIWVGFGASRFLERPTIYVLVDEGSDGGVAFWPCFGRRGSDAMACLLRDCLRRHGRLPSAIMHDLGGENTSTYWESVMARFGVDHRLHPGSAAAWGSGAESFHLRCQKLLFHQLPGNTQNDRLGRSGDRASRSDVHARLEVKTFLQIVEQGIERINRRPVGRNLPSPSEYLNEYEMSFSSMTKRIERGPEMLAATAVDAGDRRVDYTKGIRFENRVYTSPVLNDRSLDGRVLKVRYEPYDPTTLYAEINHGWYELHSADHAYIKNFNDLDRAAELIVSFDAGAARKRKRDEIDIESAAVLRMPFEASTTPVINATARDVERAPKVDDIFARIRRGDRDEG